MSGKCSCPVLLVEGYGDVEAVPYLIRRITEHLGEYTLSPASRPIKTGEYKKLARPGELEKFIKYACLRRDADSVLLLVDCDESCPVDLAHEFSERISKIDPKIDKKVGVGFFNCEFESLFLISVSELGECYKEYGWDLELYTKETPFDPENTRGAKERLKKYMKSRKYKETRDQVKFVSALDLDVLEEKSRSYRHLLALIRWLLEDKPTDSFVMPVF